MSLNSAQSPAAHHSFVSALVNEMQREDFLALAAALRQFNAYESAVHRLTDPAQNDDQAYGMQAV